MTGESLERPDEWSSLCLEDFPRLSDGAVRHARPPPARTGSRRMPRKALSPRAAILLAISFGLCGGYLDLFLMLFKKLYWNDEWILRHGRDFPWTVPVAHAILLLIPGMVIATASRLRPRVFSTAPGRGCWRRSRSGLLCSGCRCTAPAPLSWPPGWAGRSAPRLRAVSGTRGRVRYTLGGLLGLLAVLAALSSGRQAIQEKLAVAGLPPPPRVPGTSC